MTKYSELLDEKFIEKLIEFREKNDEKIFVKSNLREAFGDGILEAAESEIAKNQEKKSRIVALSADLSESVGLSKFRENLPENYVEVGIAEQNLVSIAAGMAHVGLKPFAMSYAAFNPGRNYEQIRTNIALNDVPVVIVGTHVGLNVGPDGATHQMLEDVAMMRAMPNMAVFSPADATESRSLAKFLANEKWQKPAYVRLPRAESASIFRENYEYVDTEPQEVLREGKDITLLGFGSMTMQNLLAAEILAHKNIDAEVVHVSNLSSQSIRKLCESVAKTRAIIVSAEEEKSAGFGDMIGAKILQEMAKINDISRKNYAENFIKNSLIKFERIAVGDKFGQSGTAEELAGFYGIDAKNIAKKAENLLFGDEG